ncbi:hypothetical protein L1887_05130 [Cichorium endivia]|nr:hypothetical protein L1887_05130 [Cichorium endivia]
MSALWIKSHYTLSVTSSLADCSYHLHVLQQVLKVVLMVLSGKRRGGGSVVWVLATFPGLEVNGGKSCWEALEREFEKFEINGEGFEASLVSLLMKVCFHKSIMLIKILCFVGNYGSEQGEGFIRLILTGCKSDTRGELDWFMGFFSQLYLQI